MSANKLFSNFSALLPRNLARIQNIFSGFALIGVHQNSTLSASSEGGRSRVIGNRCNRKHMLNAMVLSTDWVILIFARAILCATSFPGSLLFTSLKTIRLFLIFQACFDGTSVIVSVTVKITTVGYIILRSQVFVHNITTHTTVK